MSAPDSISTANKPWNGRWSVSRPDDYIPGLYRIHQLTARHLLWLGSRLSGWEATFLQTLAYQSKELSEMQAALLRRIERDLSEVAA